MPALGRSRLVNQRPLRIGLSARLLHQPPLDMGFHGKTLQYLEQSIAHWIMAHGALAFMLPTLGFDAEVSRCKVSVHHCVDALDGLVLQAVPRRQPVARHSNPAA